ncbi:hypothetical protein [Paraburkholderia dipogonis]|uniref:hypothetical protein n=1 Tax=Paraburkholderia dipogonis TaxID=1211383 RepID=UPI0038BBCA45
MNLEAKLNRIDATDAEPSQKHQRKLVKHQTEEMVSSPRDGCGRKRLSREKEMAKKCEEATAVGNCAGPKQPSLIKIRLI